ncbi:MAG: hypothetical protein AAGB23_05355 [Pseudomonadota bacterium]
MSGPLKAKKGVQRSWTSQEVALVERLHQQGRSYAQIACNFGVSKGAIASLFRNRITCQINPSTQGTRWRIRQLLTAGYTPSHIAEWINVPLSLALEVLDEWESEA